MSDVLARYVGRHTESLVELVSAKLTSHAFPTLDVKLITAELSYQVSTEEVVRLLEELVSDKIIFAKELQYCISDQCRKKAPQNPLNKEDVSRRVCSICQQAFEDIGEPETERYYLTRSPTSRDIRWMFVIHGFNTRGPWQEKLSWLLSNKLSYAAPVLIYKYGYERLGIFFRFRHRVLTKKLGREIQSAFDNSKLRSTEHLPDVIIHSFGSLLFSKVLTDPEFEKLRFGRVICVGSVISPTFDWDEQIKAGRVQAVLCHSGGNDLPVRIAQFAIPDTGPAGFLGFSSKAANNIRNDDFYHSTALEPENLDNQLADGGVWDRFLTDPDGRFADELEIDHPVWRPYWSFAQWLTRYAILFLLVLLLYAAWGVLAHLFLFFSGGFGQLFEMVREISRLW